MFTQFDSTKRYAYSLTSYLLLATISINLAACGGGSGSGSGDDTPIVPMGDLPVTSGGWTQGVYAQASTFAARCAHPRTGNYPDTQGTTTDENNWLRSWSNDLYLWYDEITDRNPASYQTPEYFDLLKTSAVTPSGNPKDKFHFTYDTDEWIALSQSGISAGYGAQWVIISATPPREILVAYTEPDSPAIEPAVNLVRGEKVIRIDGVDVVNANDAASVAIINAGLFPEGIDEAHNFIVEGLGGGQRTIDMTSAAITSDPVQSERTIPLPGGIVVGYMLFNDHIATAEQGLIDVIDSLDADGANVTELVLDLRYNGGGYLYIASQLAYMIAGDIPTTDRTFELIQFNDKHQTFDPVTGQRLEPMSFINEEWGTAAAGTALPTLNLDRVFVLTGPNTCSASESIINGLRGVGVDVIQIGSTTCGKPYGFYPEPNCGTTYFTIQFQGVNDIGFGDYTDGFSPANTNNNIGTVVPGCSVADDFDHALGDAAEARLATALAYILDPNPGLATCPTPSGLARRGISDATVAAPRSATDGIVRKSPWLQNRILLR